MTLWSGVRALPAPEINGTKGVYLWQIDNKKCAEISEYIPFLSVDELERAERLNSDVQRRRFILTRSVLRHLLAEKLTFSADQIQLNYGENGRPEILYPRTRVNFNVSHSEGVSLIVLADHVQVGVDVEHNSEKIDQDAIAENVFCPEELSQLQRLENSERTVLFYRLWTLKEAALKMLGTGFSLDPRQICVQDAMIGESIRVPDSEFQKGKLEWIHVKELDIGANYSAALVVGLPE